MGVTFQDDPLLLIACLGEEDKKEEKISDNDSIKALNIQLDYLRCEL